MVENGQIRGVSFYSYGSLGARKLDRGAHAVGKRTGQKEGHRTSQFMAGSDGCDVHWIEAGGGVEWEPVLPIKERGEKRERGKTRTVLASLLHGYTLRM